jgi:hypothetical protein
MNISRYKADDYENKSDLLTMEKQTQSNPILSAIGGRISDLEFRVCPPSVWRISKFLLKSAARLHLSPCYDNT